MSGFYNPPACSLFPPSAGPALPGFSSLVVHGNYHSSAPLHLCFSKSEHSTSRTADLQLDTAASDNTHGNAPVLLITASKDALGDGLRYGGWRRTGKTMRTASRVQILAPPTAVHAELLLSLLRVWTPGCEAGRPAIRKAKTSDASMGGELSSDDSAMMNTRPPAPTPASDILRANVLPACPAIIVLHEPSAYFVREDGKGTDNPRLSSYIALVSRLLHAAAAISGHRRPPVPVALFDSGIDNLYLPVTKAPSMKAPPVQHEDGEDEEEDKIEEKTPAAAEFVRRLFQWECVFENDDTIVPSSQDQEIDDDAGFARRLTMRNASAERTLAFKENRGVFMWDG